MYKFRRDDNQEVVEVDWATMMTMDVMGVIELPDGATARRVNESTEAAKAEVPIEARIVSDALGFPAQQLSDFERDRQLHGFSAIEFKPDPHVPQFIQVHCSSPDQYRRYMKHRMFSDLNSLNGSSAMVSGDMIQRAIDEERERA